MNASVMVVNRRTVIGILSVIFLVAQTVYLIGVFTRKPIVQKRDQLPGDNITDFIPPFVALLNDFRFIPNYNIMGCNVRKSMSQLNFNILCYLKDPEYFVKNNQTFSEIWTDLRPNCESMIWSAQNESLLEAERLNKLTRFAFVRNPEERFVSLFMDKCLKDNYCHNCTDLRCASKLIYDRLIVLSNNQSSFIKNAKKWWFEWHAAPQSWNCDFYKDLKDFHLISIGTSPEERQSAMRKLKRVLKYAGVEDHHIEKVVNETLENDTKHATHKSELTEQLLEQVRTDPYVRHYFQRIYYFDYVTFGFKLPDFFSHANFDFANETKA